MKKLIEVIEHVLEDADLYMQEVPSAPGHPVKLSMIAIPEAVIEVAVFGDFAREVVRNSHEIKIAKRFNDVLTVLRVDDRGVYFIPVLTDESDEPHWHALNYSAAYHCISAADGSYRRPAGGSEEEARRIAALMTSKGMPRIYAGFEPEVITKIDIK